MKGKGMAMKIALGCDPNARELTTLIKAHVESLGCEAVDFGSDDPIYANVAIAAATAVAQGRCERGILICGTGIGMSIAANKVHGAYAALCSDAYSAERARKSNNANIMTLGAFVVGPELAKTLVTIWIRSEFDPKSPSGPKVRRIVDFESEQAKRR